MTYMETWRRTLLLIFKGGYIMESTIKSLEKKYKLRYHLGDLTQLESCRSHIKASKQISSAGKNNKEFNFSSLV